MVYLKEVTAMENREKQLLKIIERLERKISDLNEKCNNLSYALELEKSLNKHRVQNKTEK